MFGFGVRGWCRAAGMLDRLMVLHRAASMPDRLVVLHRAAGMPDRLVVLQPPFSDREHC